MELYGIRNHTITPAVYVYGGILVCSSPAASSTVSSNTKKYTTASDAITISQVTNRNLLRRQHERQHE